MREAADALAAARDATGTTPVQTVDPGACIAVMIGWR